VRPAVVRRRTIAVSGTIAGHESLGRRMHGTDHRPITSREGFLAEVIAQSSLLNHQLEAGASDERRADALTPAAVLKLAAEARSRSRDAAGSHTGHRVGPRRCPAGCVDGPVGVTPLEALAAAAELRHELDRDKLRCLRSRLVELAERFASNAPPCPGKGPSQCGLFSKQTGCHLADALPIVCLGGGQRQRWAAMIDANDAPSRGPRWQLVGGEGPSPTAVRDRLRHGLAVPGLDMDLYEINGAVLRALNVRGGLARWLDGEDIFRGCLQLEQLQRRQSLRYDPGEQPTPAT